MIYLALLYCICLTWRGNVQAGRIAELEHLASRLDDQRYRAELEVQGLRRRLDKIASGVKL